MRTPLISLAVSALLATASSVSANAWRITLVRPAPQSNARADAAWDARRELDAARTAMRQAQFAALRGSLMYGDLVTLRAKAAEASGRAIARRQALVSGTWSSPDYVAARNAVASAEKALAVAHADPKLSPVPAALSLELVTLRAALRAIESKALDTDADYRTARADATAAAAEVRNCESQLAAAAAVDPGFLRARQHMIAVQAKLMGPLASDDGR